MIGYRITEVYKRGEKAFKGKQYRLGWNVYRDDGRGAVVLIAFLKEAKEVKNEKRRISKNYGSR